MSKYWIGKSGFSKVAVFFAGDIGFLIDESESSGFVNPKGWIDCWAQSNFTNITADYLRNTKIRIESPEHSRTVQLLARECGYNYSVGGPTAVRAFDKSKWLYFDDEGFMSTSQPFKNVEYKEIHLPTLPELQLSEVKEPSQKIITDNDRLSSTVKDAIKETVGDVLREMVGRESLAAISTLEDLGYTYHGAELWRPPLGECPEHICGEWPQVGDEVFVTHKFNGNEESANDLCGRKALVVNRFTHDNEDLIVVKNDCSAFVCLILRLCIDKGVIIKPQTPQEKLAEVLAGEISERTNKPIGDGAGEIGNSLAKAILDGEIPGLMYEGGDV